MFIGYFIFLAHFCRHTDWGPICVEAAILCCDPKMNLLTTFVASPDCVRLKKTRIDFLIVCNILSYGTALLSTLGETSSTSQMFCTQPVWMLRLSKQTNALSHT